MVVTFLKTCKQQCELLGYFAISKGIVRLSWTIYTKLAMLCLQ